MTRVLLLLLPLLLLGACATTKKKEEPPPSAPPPSAPEAASGVQIQLLDAGAEPRALMRYAANAGREAVFFNVATEVMGSPLLTTIPLELATSAGESDGTIVATLGTPSTKAGSKADAAVVEGYTSTMHQQPAAVTFHVTPEGLATFEATIGVVNLAQFVVPFPQEAIGKGARWRVVSVANDGGELRESDTSYKLEGSEDGVFLISNQSVQHAVVGTVEIHNIADGVTCFTPGKLVCAPSFARMRMRATDNGDLQPVSGMVLTLSTTLPKPPP